MKNFTIMAIGVMMISAVIGSLVFHLIYSPSMPTLKEKCYQIANEAFEIQQRNSDLNLDNFLDEDRNKLVYLDEIWFRECVSKLSEEEIFDMAQTIANNYYLGE